MARKLETISKFMAKPLRHAPDALGLTLQPGGGVSADDLLAASERAGFKSTYDELPAHQPICASISFPGFSPRRPAWMKTR